MPTERRVFIAAIVAGTVLRVAQVATSLGSFDALLWSNWAELIARVGVLRAYQFSELMNHPPFVLLIAATIDRMGAAVGITFADAFRLLQIAADLVTAFALVRIGTRVCPPSAAETPRARGTAAALVFYLSPAVIFISAFHCNSDPLMMMFVVLAVLAAIEARPAWCGALLACAVGVKIVPLLVGPLFLIAFRGRHRLQFLAAAVVTFAAIFLPGLVVSGPLFLERVFGYTGMVRSWGIPLIGQLLERFAGFGGIRAATPLLPSVMLLAVASIWVLAARSVAGEPARLPQSIGAAWIVFLFLAPGFGLQYLYWALPFAFFTLPRVTVIAVHGVLSIYLFVVYTAWSGGWPWWFADRAKSADDIRTIVVWGLGSWLLLGVAGAIAVWRLYRHGSDAAAQPESGDPSLHSG